LSPDEPIATVAPEAVSTAITLFVRKVNNIIKGITIFFNTYISF
jgi:hypothetical protein